MYFKFVPNVPYPEMLILEFCWCCHEDAKLSGPLFLFQMFHILRWWCCIFCLFCNFCICVKPQYRTWPESRTEGGLAAQIRKWMQEKWANCIVHTPQKEQPAKLSRILDPSLKPKSLEKNVACIVLIWLHLNSWPFLLVPGDWLLHFLFAHLSLQKFCTLKKRCTPGGGVAPGGGGVAHEGGVARSRPFSPATGLPTTGEVLATDDRFSTLLAAITVAFPNGTNLEPPFTVFAPTNSAFAKLPEGSVDKLLEVKYRNDLQVNQISRPSVFFQDPESLRDVLLRHIVAGKAVSFLSEWSFLYIYNPQGSWTIVSGEDSRGFWKPWLCRRGKPQHVAQSRRHLQVSKSKDNQLSINQSSINQSTSALQWFAARVWPWKVDPGRGWWKSSTFRHRTGSSTQSTLSSDIVWYRTGSSMQLTLSSDIGGHPHNWHSHLISGVIHAIDTVIWHRHCHLVSNFLRSIETVEYKKVWFLQY